MRALRWFLWGTVGLTIALFALFAFMLDKEPDNLVHSAMVGQAIPQFALPAAVPGQAGLSLADLADGRPKLLNVFGSWCAPCQVESPQLAALKQQGATLVGVAVRDRPEELAVFLSQYGNPFSRIGIDNQRTFQFLIGSSGVPETFVIDGKGVIREQHIGEVRPEDVPELLEALRNAA